MRKRERNWHARQNFLLTLIFENALRRYFRHEELDRLKRQLAEISW